MLVGPKKPTNVGAVARACNCFEVEDLRVVDAACPITVRSAQNAAMGGQRLLWQAAEFGNIEDALQDCSYSVAFARWPEGECPPQTMHLLNGHVRWRIQIQQGQRKEGICL